MAFGVISTSVLSGNLSNNKRRKIYWQFPQGAAQLTGLLSLLPNAEETDKSEFGWHERRMPTQLTTTTTTGVGTSDPFSNGDGTALTDGGAGVTLTAGTEYRLKVASTDQFKPTHVIEIRDVLLSSGASAGNLTGVVTSIVSTTVLKFRPNVTTAAVDNSTAGVTNVGLSVAIKGTANRENARSGSGIYVTPIAPTNYTQIFRTAFNISRTALKAGTLYDSSGAYANLSKENGMRHMIEMEKAFLFGEKATIQVADPETGDITPETQTGGVEWYLKQWEAANSIYRGGAGAAAITSNTDPNKRIIDLGANGTLSMTQLNQYLANAFAVTQDVGNEKVGLCGNGFLMTINSLLGRDVVRQTVLDEKTSKVRLVFHSIETMNGTIHFKTHPLFTQDPYLNYNCMILDLGNLRNRPLTDSDTKFLKGRQETDRDGRKDEWIGEMGLELKYPESCMYIKRATAAA